MSILVRMICVCCTLCKPTYDDNSERCIVIAEARQMLREDAIIGISVSNTTEAQKAIEMDANYVGIGTLFATPTYVAATNAS